MTCRVQGKICKFSLGRATLSFEPVMCNGHLPYPWGQHWREEEGELDAAGGGGGRIFTLLLCGSVNIHHRPPSVNIC